MDIDKDFLPFIFSKDILYVDDLSEIASESETIAESKAKAPSAGKEEIKKSETVEPKADSSKVLVLLDHSPEGNEATLLNNILKAIQLEEKDIQYIYKHPAKFNELRQTKLMLSFQSEYAPKESYTIEQVHNVQIIYAHDLGSLEANITYKKQLWVNLKQLKI